MRKSTSSLLRYPGSKARLVKFIADTIKLNGINRPVFVEPFCGGASVSIALLESNIVDEIILNDVDPIIASLWKCVFSKKDAIWLAGEIKRVPINLEYWSYQKNMKPRSVREAALKCLFLNRTSFSGILNSRAGPIGGRKQGKWKLGCRFNRESISSRIIELANLSARVREVTHQSWESACERWRRRNGYFFYLDPPFYHKADRLYRFVFDNTQHLKLRDYLLDFSDPWVLSYDNAVEIRSIYDGLQVNARLIDNTYSAHPIGGNSFIGREVLYSNLKKLPLPIGELTEHAGISVRKFTMVGTSGTNPLRIPVSLH